MTIATIKKGLVNLFYPLHCASCKIHLDPLNEFGLCGSCRSKIIMNPKPYCKSCGRPMTNAANLCADCRKTKFSFSGAYSACLYEGVVKELIHIFKFKSRISLAKVLSQLLINFAKDNPRMLDGIDMVSFVPLEKSRLRHREFNQSKILSYNFSKEFGLNFADILEKPNATKHQNELSRAERVTNLKGAFRARKGVSSIIGSRILLIDDVMTTGTTLNECSMALKEALAEDVRCFTLARGTS